MLRYEQAQVDEKMSKDKKEKMSRRAALILRLFNAYNNTFCKRLNINAPQALTNSYDLGAKDGTKRAILRLISMYLCCKFLSC